MYKVPNANSTNDIRGMYAYYYVNHGMRDWAKIVPALAIVGLGFIVINLPATDISVIQIMIGVVVFGVLVGILGAGVGFVVGLIAGVCCRMLPLSVLQSSNFPLLITAIITALLGTIVLVGALSIPFPLWIAIIFGITVAGWTWWRSQTLQVAVTNDHAAVVEPLQQ